jgi:hypothetical protein
MKVSRVLLRLSLALAAVGALAAPAFAAPQVEGTPAATSAPCEMRPIHSLPGRGHVWGSIYRPVGNCAPAAKPVSLTETADAADTCARQPIHSLPGRGHVWGSIYRDCGTR